jgi:hypothetical protein
MAHDTACAWAQRTVYRRKEGLRPKDLHSFDHAFQEVQVLKMSKLSQRFGFAPGTGHPHQFRRRLPSSHVGRLINPNLILGADSTVQQEGWERGHWCRLDRCGDRHGNRQSLVSRTQTVDQHHSKLPRGVIPRMLSSPMPAGGRRWCQLSSDRIGGETVEGFNVPARLTLTNMSAEMGAKATVSAGRTDTRLPANDRLIEFEGCAVMQRTVRTGVELRCVKPQAHDCLPTRYRQRCSGGRCASRQVVVDQVFIGSHQLPDR